MVYPILKIHKKNPMIYGVLWLPIVPNWCIAQSLDVPRNSEFFRSWLLRWYPVVDRHAAIESLQAAVCSMTQAEFLLLSLRCFRNSQKLIG